MRRNVHCPKYYKQRKDKHPYHSMTFRYDFINLKMRTISTIRHQALFLFVVCFLFYKIIYHFKESRTEKKLCQN